MSKGLLPMFSSRSFIVSGLTFKFLIHCKFTFVPGMISLLKEISSMYIDTTASDRPLTCLSLCFKTLIVTLID